MKMVWAIVLIYRIGCARQQQCQGDIKTERFFFLEKKQLKIESVEITVASILNLED